MTKREREYRERIERRSRVNAEDEAARFILRAVGRSDLHRELACIDDGFEDWPKMRVEDIHDHQVFQEHWPMRLQYRHRDCEEDPISLHDVLTELHVMPGTLIFCEQAQHDACGVITTWNDELVLLHNRPEWFKQESEMQITIKGITLVVVHPFERTIKSIARRCRDEMADDDEDYDGEDYDDEDCDDEDYYDDEMEAERPEPLKAAKPRRLKK